MVLLLIASGLFAQSEPKDSCPAGMTKNMVWLPKAVMGGKVGEFGVIALFYDGKEYLVMDAPKDLNLAVSETTPALLVRGGIGSELYKNHRMWNWFSRGEITPELIKNYPKRRFSASCPLN